MAVRTPLRMTTSRCSLMVLPPGKGCQLSPGSDRFAREGLRSKSKVGRADAGSLCRRPALALHQAAELVLLAPRLPGPYCAALTSANASIAPILRSAPA